LGGAQTDNLIYMNKKISVDAVIAAKDSADTIGETIESLLDSTVTPQNIWVVDDGSSDNTGQIAATYDGVEVLRNDVNRERSFSRNRGIRQSDADFIQILDADDLVANNKIQIQHEYLTKHQNVDAVYGARVAFTGSFDKENTDQPLLYRQSSDLLREVLRKNIIIPGMLLFRKRFFDQFGWFDEEIKIAEDRELIIRALIDGAVIHQTPEALTYYRRHPDSSVVTGYREGLYNNYLMFIKLYEDLKKYKEGSYRKDVAGSLRMMARNLNIYGFAFELVKECIAKAESASSDYNIEQKRIYDAMDRILGPELTERLLRPKFKLDHLLGRYDS